ncbi:hypothetical protein KP509_04G090700 [Ceratopteris richardii]|nr:hypothetical protein KP509_04G090700 [Ceratopteris richardii]
MEDTWITCIPGLPPVRASDFVREFMPTEEEMEADPKKCEGLLKVVKESYGGARNLYRLLVNSIYELDSNATDDLRAEGVHVLPVGPLFLQNSSKGIIERPRINALEEDQTCLQWLDGREASSVLYIAFGSEARLLKDDMQELAYGLEASGHSFLWVIRPGSVVDEQSFDCILPEGFEERTAAHGKIVSWAPQMEVLAHSAIGGFMSHCGWNSTLEALCHGVPILAWPQRADQGLNKVFIEDHWKVGIAVQKHGGKVKRAAVETAIKQLMTEERGALVRKRVKEVKDTVWKSVQEDGSSRRHLDEFIHALNSLADQKSM